jgi:predicted nucleic acid-binding protein
MEADASTKQFFVDASVFITLAEIDCVNLLDALDGEVVVPRAVAAEISDEPAVSHFEAASDDWLRIADAVEVAGREEVEHAASHLGTDLGERDGNDSALADFEGDVALLALGMTAENPVVVTDDKPLRQACKALGVSLSRSIGVLVASVERGTLSGDDAKDALVAMDEVGARLSASLFRRAERPIEQATD